MTQPQIVHKGPFAVALEAGKTYAWCACGKSANQPFCDGSHSGSGLTPLVFQAMETATVYLCGCKQSGKRPFCDGSHQGSSFTPTKFEASETKTVYFCGCKQSKNGVLCDGSHNAL